MNVVTIYGNEDCSEIIGKARLIKLVKKGLPVILDGSYSERRQPIYRFDKYKVEFVDGTIPNSSSEYYVRVLHRIGRAIKETAPEEYKILEKDKFLKINGKQIY